MQKYKTIPMKCSCSTLKLIWLSNRSILRNLLVNKNNVTLIGEICGAPLVYISWKYFRQSTSNVWQ